MALSSIDQQKLLNAGFTIIRKDDTSRLVTTKATATTTSTIERKKAPIIKAKQGERHEWFTLEKDFSSTAARDRRMNELLLKSNYIED